MELLFAALAIRANQVVSFHQLTTEIWGDDPPRRASAALHVYISQLRKLLQPSEGGPAPIVTQAPGYLLHTTGEQDFSTFDRLLTSGRALLAQCRHAEAETDLTAALELWRGPALGDAQGNGPIVRGFVAWAEAARLECTELQIDARLALGSHRMVIGDLYRLISEHPLREAFYRQLMLALYQADLRADALRVYRSARATLASELGVEPCLRLRRLHQQILLGDQSHLGLAG
ncbi:AfsR/SARP family transcriptional regulator [Lentzea sp. NPDC004789]